MSRIPAQVKLAVLFLSVAATASAADWQRIKAPLLTNFNNMYNPCVVETGGKYRYKMWFFGWASKHANPGTPGADAIYHARSKDLKKWEVYSKNGTWDDTMAPSKWAPVLHASDRYHESWHTGDPSVAMKDGKFYMAYSASSKPGHRKGPGLGEAAMLCCIMGATSPDGIHWTKTGQPLLIESKEAQKAQDISRHFMNFLRPSLHWEGGRWRLWFDYWVPGKGVCMGYAEARKSRFTRKGAFKIKHDLKKPILEQWPNPEVVKVGHRYLAFGDPPGYLIKPGESNWKNRQIRMAVSKDGTTWKKLDFIPPDKDADACHVPRRSSRRSTARSGSTSSTRHRSAPRRTTATTTTNTIAFERCDAG